MKRLLCWFHRHDWVLNSDIVVTHKTIRTCRRCGIKEIIVGYDTKEIWVRFKDL